MATLYSPKVVTNGLVLSLDAANPKSYPGSGTTWTDLSGNENNGTLTNGPTFNTGNGGSIAFDGVDDRISIPFTTDLQNSTVSTWINFNTLNKYFFTVSGTSPGYYQWYVFNNGTLQFEYSRTTPSLAASALISTTNSVVTNTWYNLTIVISALSGTEQMYRNGILLTSDSWTAPGPITPTTFNLGQTCDARIGYTQIYNRALSAQEVLQNFNATRSRFGI